MAPLLELLAACRTRGGGLRSEPWPLSPPPLCVAMAESRYNLGTARMSEITITRLGWPAGALV